MKENREICRSYRDKSGVKPKICTNYRKDVFILKTSGLRKDINLMLCQECLDLMRKDHKEFLARLKK